MKVTTTKIITEVYFNEYNLPLMERKGDAVAFERPQANGHSVRTRLCYEDEKGIHPFRRLSELKNYLLKYDEDKNNVIDGKEIQKAGIRQAIYLGLSTAPGENGGKIPLGTSYNVHRFEIVQLPVDGLPLIQAQINLNDMTLIYPRAEIRSYNAETPYHNTFSGYSPVDYTSCEIIDGDKFEEEMSLF